MPSWTRASPSNDGPRPGRSSLAEAWDRFRGDRPALAALCAVALLFAAALYAPLLAGGKPLLMRDAGALRSPALREFLAPSESTEALLERAFNYAALALPLLVLAGAAARALGRSAARRRVKWLAAALLLACAVPFVPGVVKPRLDTTDYRAWKADPARASGDWAILPPVHFGPYEQFKSFQRPGGAHPLGTDQVGRVICFPTFLLIITIMALLDRRSILNVMLVIGLTGWTGLSRLVRGSVLAQKGLDYVTAARALGARPGRVIFRHLLPNSLAPVYVWATFGVAGAILTESGLSFLGFGVSPPAASWGEMLNEALAHPFLHWWLMTWPGAMIFLTVTLYNLVGEGARDALDPRLKH